MKPQTQNPEVWLLSNALVERGKLSISTRNPPEAHMCLEGGNEGTML